MTIDINKIMAELLAGNKQCREDGKYKVAWSDGCLDFYNKIKKVLEKDT